MRFLTRDLLITSLPSRTGHVELDEGAVCTECTQDTLCGGTIACTACTDCSVCTFCSCKVTGASTTCKEAEALHDDTHHGFRFDALVLESLRAEVRGAIAETQQSVAANDSSEPSR